MFASRSNLSFPPHLIWIILLLSSLILNENGWLVAGRTWPRMKSYGKIYSKDALFIANVTSTTTAAPSPVTAERRNSLSEINFSRSPGDYKLLNGNGSSSSSHHHQHSNGDGDNFKLNGGSGRWWTNDTNYVAGPFHSSGDLNESVFNALCPSPNGKSPIPGVCGWYAACVNGKELTLNRCAQNGDTFSVERGRCIKSNATCKDELGDDIEHQTPNEILQQILKSQKRVGAGRALSLSSNHNNNEHLEESEAILANHVSQSSTPSDSKPISPSSGLISSSPQSDLENLCESTSSHGLHAHPHLCNKYIQCGSAAGTYFVKECGPGTVFNREMLVCDWPVNVPECRSSNFQNGNRLEKRSISASPKIIAGDNLRFPISKERRGKRVANGNGGEKCDGSKKDYISPDPTDCSKYRVCSNSRIVTVTCGQGTLFNPTSGVCDFADKVDCTSRKADLGAYGCDKGDSYKAPHPEFCNKFVECDDGVLAIKSCPPATLYDREAATCDHTSRVTCRKPISFEHDIDVNHKPHQVDDEEHRERKLITKRSIFSRASRSNKLNLACEYNYIAPHPTICNRFVECEDRRIFIKTCGPGTAFNPLIGQCDWPHKVREPDPRDCTKYQQCVRSHYEGRSCGYNQIFDPRQGNCVKATSYEIQQCRLRNTPRTTTRPLTPTPSFSIS